ncbi:alkaline phosphatase family protein [Haloferax larsenii]|uniref:Alkaline phosphatase family protein n=1 Tax=Haloferax larsenii TaxID=302484 RepID=A0ABY5RDN1_HALLR|nr:alkaline phosphatase family protein [Haloferax larsenii]ELZ78278.1 type I phosphodiesterase/nucleotide pyrophosphatase [Haloferax larsenii JCM 13917]UVE50436.1 alkaline phosphatase family protein [Haloferax larsenii]
MSADRRVLLVGLDAGCLDVMQPMFDDGLLPNLQDIFDRGASAPLESQVPQWTPSAWPSLYTGVNPAKHGVFGFLTYDGYDWRISDATDIAESTLWELLSERGLRSVVVNAPVTHPPREFDGALIPGYIGPEDPATHPPGLLADVREAIGEYRVYGEDEFNRTTSDAERVPASVRADEYKRLIRSRGEAFVYLTERFDPDFGFVEFQRTDTAVHDFPGDLDLLREVYRATDEQVGHAIEAFDPDVVLVASDHGIGPYEDVEFRVNEFLSREGYVETVRDKEGSPSWIPLWKQDLKAPGESASAPGDEPSVVDRVRDRTLTTAANTVERLGLTSVVKRLVPQRTLRAADVPARVDFENSRAYMRTSNELGIRINLAGREPAGVVSPDEYESLRLELIEKLSTVRTPDGDPVFDAVVPREAVFEGPFIEAAPDIMLLPRDFETFPEAELRGDLFGPMYEPWNHKPYGVVAIAGDGFDPTASLGTPHLLDIAPTVLSLLGLPRSDRMEGAVLPGVTSTAEATYERPVDRDSARDVGDDVESRLQGLGYL